MSGKSNADERDDDARDDEARGDGADSIADFLSQFNGGAHQFMVTRVEPRQVVVRGQPKRITGHLATLLSPPTLDDLREQWGGGVYEIRVNSRTAKGPRFVTCRRVEIAGDPKLPIDDTPPEPPVAGAAVPTPPAESPALLQQILEHTFEDKRRVEERFERERQRVLAERQVATADPSLLQTTLGAIERTQREQIETLRQQLGRRDQEMSELRQHLEAARGKGSPLDNPEVLRVLFGRSQEDANRTTDQLRQELQLERDRHDRDVQAERDRHQRQLDVERERNEREIEVERRDREQGQRDIGAVREQQQRALELERERHQRESDAQRERYQRELETERERRENELAAERREHEQQLRLIERLHGSELENLRTSHAQLVATKDEHIGRLNEDLRTLRTAARPPDALGDLERVGKVVHAVRNFVPGLGGEAAEETSGWERLIDHARPLIEKVADNLSKPPPVHVFPPPVASTTQRRNLLRRPPAQVLRPHFRRSAPPPAATPTATSAPPESAPTSPTAIETSVAAPSTAIAEGLNFLEAAFKGSRPVEEVARTASSLFPKGDLRALMQAGPDLLVGEIEQRSPDSLLASSGGRRYLRDLLAALEQHVEPAS
ncbi:MAG: hypothetical protein JWM53_4806 [bacterium]|nr:hypothetical protein [bacterium]